MVMKIDLDELTQGGRVHNLSGRPLGEQSRNWAKVEAMDNAIEAVSVEIPNHIYSISPSFFLGMFGESVLKLNGPEPFFKKYQFTGPTKVVSQVRQWADRAMLEGL